MAGSWRSEVWLRGGSGSSRVGLRAPLASFLYPLSWKRSGESARQKPWWPPCAASSPFTPKTACCTGIPPQEGSRGMQLCSRRLASLARLPTFTFFTGVWQLTSFVRFAILSSGAGLPSKRCMSFCTLLPFTFSSSISFTSSSPSLRLPRVQGYSSCVRAVSRASFSPFKLAFSHLPTATGHLLASSGRRLSASSYDAKSASVHAPGAWPCALQLHTSLLSTLLQRGEIVAPTDVQERSLPSLVAGESSLILAPTGSGKTLAWALPLLSRLLHADSERLAPYPRQPRLLVLAPSRELVQQLLLELRKHFNGAGISIASAAAGQSYVKEVRALMGGGVGEGGHTRGADVLICTPARLLLHLHKKNVNLKRVKTVVVEEADTLCDTFYQQELLVILNILHQAEWAAPVAGTAFAMTAAGRVTVQSDRGESNGTSHHRGLQLSSSPARKDFSAAGKSQKQLTTTFAAAGTSVPMGAASADHSPVQLVFVAATKTGALGCFLKQQLRSIRLRHICASDAHLTPSGVQQVFVPLGNQDRLSRLLEILDEKAAGATGALGAHGNKTIIFCNTINCCRAVDLTLVEKGYRVSCLHGMMPFKLRKTSFRRFKEGQTDILVCTNVASRGLDIDGVEHVIMFDFPQTLTDFLHRGGRTARGGDSGRVTLLFSRRNLPLLQQIQSLSKATLSPPELRQKAEDKHAVEVFILARHPADADPGRLLDRRVVPVHTKCS